MPLLPSLLKSEPVNEFIYHIQACIFL